MTEFRDVVGAIVGKNITVRRRQLGITDEQFSQSLGVEPDVLRQYESGARRVDAKLLLSIGLILDVPPTYFFSNNETKSEQSSIYDVQTDDFETERELFLKEGVALNCAFARISKSKSRQVLIDFALALAEMERMP